KKTQELREKNAVLEEEIVRRQEAETKLSFQLELERFFSQIFSRFLTNLPLPDLARFALEKVGNFLQTEYLIARLPKEEYLFTIRDHQRPTPLLPTLLKDQSLKERFFREQKLILPIDAVFSELQKGILFSCPLSSTPEEGFLEGILSENATQREEKRHHLPILMDYLRTLFEYITAVQKQREQDRWFMVTLQSLGDAVITTDPEGLVTYLNPVAENLTLWTLAEARGKSIEEVFVIVDEKSGKIAPNPVQKVLAEGRVTGFANHTLLIRRDGEQINIDGSGAPIIGENGEIQEVVLVFRDVTEKRRLEIQVQESERTYRSLFNALPDGFLLLEAIAKQGELINYRIIEVNPAFRNFFSYYPDFSGKLLSEVFPNWKEQWPLPSKLPLILGIKPFRKEISLPELNSFWEITSFILSPHRLGVIISDITQRKNAEERIRYFMFHDSLTGLYNRLFAEEELKRLDDGRHIPLSIIFADLNGLKFINDIFGHHQGDMMLKKAAHILKTSCRQGDVVARFGGDEFLVILPNTPYSLVTKIAQRIQRHCAEEKKKNPFFLGLSVGTATKVEPTEDLWTIIQAAEEASYERKLQERQLYQEKAALPLLEKGLFQLHYEEKEEIQKLKETALKLGQKLQLSQEELHKISLLASFHDVGKLTLPPEIIKKQGPLTEEEQILLESCPTAGYRIARTNQELLLIAEEIYAFREHYDGSGYPLRKKGEEIPSLTRIVQIVEAYWALRSPRPYRPEPLSHVQALATLQKEAGYRFDPELVEAFLSFSKEEVSLLDIHRSGG
ncbi:MAG: sensor domain-containing diguanylate cyclase/phosphohydrolase, partial [Candidatus Caldatribacteriaceae bacterium]